MNKKLPGWNYLPKHLKIGVYFYIDKGKIALDEESMQNELKSKVDKIKKNFKAK